MTAATATACISSHRLSLVLALQGAETRLAKAEVALADFFTEHGAAAPQFRAYHYLLVERDDAARQLEKARLDVVEIGVCA